LATRIEVSASVAALWRLYCDRDLARRARTERITLRVIGVLFLGLAAYIAAAAVHALLARTSPERSFVGIALATASLVVMPFLARAQRRGAVAIGSGAVAAEAQQTMFCTYLSAILLAVLVPECHAGLVVGRSHRGARHGARHCAGRS
jgi:predicted Co/Zn/Cd cation transporter (cation efflux family)